MLGIFADAVLGAAMAAGVRMLRNSFAPDKIANRWLAVPGLFLLGVLVGGLSLLLFGSRVTPDLGIRGLSLVLAPVCVGAALEGFGRLAESGGTTRTPLLTWWGGGSFALGAAVPRFLALA